MFSFYIYRVVPLFALVFRVVEKLIKIPYIIYCVCLNMFNFIFNYPTSIKKKRIQKTLTPVL